MKKEENIDYLLESRFFVDHSDGFVETIIEKASMCPQKISEFGVLVRSIILPEPRITLAACLVASFFIGIFSSQIEAASINDLNSFMYYEGEIL